jgi:hypothetical protein
MDIASAIVSTLLALIALVALIAGLHIRRGFQIKLLLEDGINIDGVVTKQWRRERRGPAKARYYLRYRYSESHGNEHTRKLTVGHDHWAAHPPGSTIAICYSASKPGVSAPREVVALARKAMQWNKT